MERCDATFPRVAAPYETRYVETRFGLAHVVISGNESGKPVVLWHGQSASAASWAHCVPALSSAYLVYALDVVGGMGKSVPTRPSKKGLAYGRWAAEVLDRLALRRAHMIGASQGGWLIGKLANVAPATIGSAILMSSAGFLPGSVLQTFRMLPRVLFKAPSEAAQAMLAPVSGPGVPPDPFFLELLELTCRR